MVACGCRISVKAAYRKARNGGRNDQWQGFKIKYISSIFMQSLCGQRKAAVKVYEKYNGRK
jgi:hypothetical protein